VLFEILPDPRTIPAPVTEDSVSVLQFHRPIPERVPIGHFEAGGREVVDMTVDRRDYLEWVQQACATLGDGLEIRFYDHFEDVFDASVLDSLSDIHRLSLDGLPEVRHPEAVGRLPKLTSLRFGPRRVNHPRVLDALGVERLTHFTLAGTPAPAIDLSPLAGASRLRSLRLLGHGKHAEAIGALPALTELAIQPSTRFPLEFISRLVSLESLKFVLGQCSSIRPIGMLPELRDLSFREVRHLEDLGGLERFPRLRRLQVSDQPKVADVNVGPRNLELEHLYLYSVPGLHTVSGFSQLPAVKSLFAYDSRLDLLDADLPPTLTHFRLMTKGVRGRDAHAAQVRAKGLVPDVHPEATFFYK
jgi:hypothetical protein